MCAEGHIIGVLWIILLGRYLDNRNAMYEHSYGNRLRSTIFDDDKDVSFYPGMFEPYFSQYKNWRDKGIDIAQENLKENNDIIILTMDFKRFYYSVNYTKNEFDYLFQQIYKNKFRNNNDDNDNTYVDCVILQRLHDFVYAVIERYSKKLRNIEKNEGLWYQKSDEDNEPINVLPIGFLPSNILANKRLDIFDKNIMTRWNPLYYGRYVDDIIIVDKIDKKSTIHDSIFCKKENANNIIEYFLANCNATKCDSCVNEIQRALLLKNDKQNSITTENSGENSNKEKTIQNNDDFYYINPFFLNYIDHQLALNININNNSLIRVQKEKVKLFVFSSDASDKLLSCFKNEVLKNSSEFRFLPEADMLYRSEIYDKLYDLKYSDSINKLNSVFDIEVNRFELSKFLGKQMTINSLTITNPKETIEEINILKKILTPQILIDNYLLWERILEMLLLKRSHNGVSEFVELIFKAITNIKYQDKKKIVLCQRSLLSFLGSALCRVLALSWGENSEQCLSSIWTKTRSPLTKSTEKKFLDTALKIRKRYCTTRMLNKYLIPISLEWIFGNNCTRLFKIIKSKEKINLFDFNAIINLVYEPAIRKKQVYKYIPYSTTPHEINFSIYTFKLKNNKPINISKETQNYYQIFNYNIFNDDSKNNGMSLAANKSVNSIVNIYTDDRGRRTDKKISSSFLSIQGDEKIKLKVAIANTKIYNENLKSLIEGFPNRSMQRYSALEEILRSALHEKVDLLVFPENFLPYEWLPRVMSFCAKNQMGIITGVEHLILAAESGNSKLPRNIIDKYYVFNLTAVLLPYKLGVYRYTSLSLHSKIYFSPGEIEFLRGYNLQIKPGNIVHLFKWHDIYFTVHCCFELSSIHLRQSFFKYADLIVGIEHNRDVFYYSGIMESLCRDMHAYCLQVNSSDYGDSRLTQPKSSVFLDMMRVKGGLNNMVMVSEIDIAALRKFQLQQYSAQIKDKSFKPTPPGFDSSIVYNKIHGCLDLVIEEELKNNQ